MSLLFAAGCTSEDEFSALRQSTENGVSKPMTANERAISRYIGARKARTRSVGDPVLVPYTVGGDTVMYVANYGNGWEVFANDVRVPMVVMRSDKGSFYPSENLMGNVPFAFIFHDVANAISRLKSEPASEDMEIDASWKNYVEPAEVASDIPGAETFYMKSDISEENTEHFVRGDLLPTSWGGDYPFNQYTPLLSDSQDNLYHPVAGCVAVAVSQYIYWHNRTFGIPASTVDTAVYDEQTRTYSFSGNSTDIWETMYNRDCDPAMVDDAEAMRTTALFVGYVAKLVNTEFDIEKSTSTNENAISVLEANIGETFKTAWLTDGNLIGVLDSGYPLLCGSEVKASEGEEVYESGYHMYMVDYALKRTTTNVSYWGTPVILDSDDDIEEPDWDYSEYVPEQWKGYKIIVEAREFVMEQLWASMNWGFGGFFDDVVFNVSYLTFEYTSGDLDFNAKKTIVSYPSKLRLNNQT